LFILSIDPLQRIIEVAANRGILNLVLPRAANLRCSLYADDEAIFASPSNLEIDHLHRILSFFGECSGLKINISKTEIYPIRLDTNTIMQLLQNFPGKVCNFPGKYLGLPLHVRKLRKIDVQPLLDKIGARLPGWKGEILIFSWERDVGKNGAHLSTNLPHTVFPEL